jgi:DNA repair exonuclease SbcCD nuclease subunit
MDNVWRYTAKDSSDEKYLIIVTFDGEPELWMADDKTLALQELLQHYFKDWKDTNRRLPCEIFDRTDYCELDLRKETPTITTKAMVLEEGKQIAERILSTPSVRTEKKKKKTLSKFEKLMKIEGFTDEMEFLQEVSMDSVCPGICSNKDCDYTTEVEPDQDAGWCEECDQGSVKSALVLKGII